MHLEVTFKNLRPRKEVRERAELLFGKLERFLEPASEGQLTVEIEHQDAIVELIVNAWGETHTVSHEEDDLRTSLDKVFHTMETRLRRHKERRVDARRVGAPEADGFTVAEIEEA
ncbi:MAG: HPF/RaiA family ribosome-associated protein [Myxococcota bacterium]